MWKPKDGEIVYSLKVTKDFRYTSIKIEWENNDQILQRAFEQGIIFKYENEALALCRKMNYLIDNFKNSNKSLYKQNMVLSTYIIDVYAYRKCENDITFLYAEEPIYSERDERYMCRPAIGVLNDNYLEALGLTPEMVTEKPWLIKNAKINILIE